jgi:hypothetical protein
VRDAERDVPKAGGTGEQLEVAWREAKKKWKKAIIEKYEKHDY